MSINSEYFTEKELRCRGTGECDMDVEDTSEQSDHGLHVCPVGKGYI